MRDGVPLPGATPPVVISQLAHRVFGPLRLDRVRAMLDYHGLAGHPAAWREVVAARHGITTRTLSSWRRAVKVAGAHLPLSVDLAAELTRRTRPGEDHLGRTRTATTLGLPPPPAAHRTPTHPRPVPRGPTWPRPRSPPGSWPRSAPSRSPSYTPRSAGPAASSPRPPPTARQLTTALTAIGATRDDQGRWPAPDDVAASDRHRALVTIAAGRDLTRRAMIDALVTAGYTPTSAEARKISNHPLIRHIGPDRYRIVRNDSPEPAP